MQWFILKKLNEVQSKEQHQAEIANRFAGLEDFDTNVHTSINSASETITKNMLL
jgi:hypothetical protein